MSLAWLGFHLMINFQVYNYTNVLFFDIHKYIYTKYNLQYIRPWQFHLIVMINEKPPRHHFKYTNIRILKYTNTHIQNTIQHHGAPFSEMKLGSMHLMRGLGSNHNLKKCPQDLLDWPNGLSKKLLCAVGIFLSFLLHCNDHWSAWYLDNILPGGMVWNWRDALAFV